jgi:hypothetical protein
MKPWSSCRQLYTLQGFVHIIFPLEIKNINEERIKIDKSQVKDLDKFKNNNIFNNTIIDILKEIISIQGCGNGYFYVYVNIIKKAILFDIFEQFNIKNCKYLLYFT